MSMQELAGLAPGQDGMSSLERVVGEYEKWIERRQQEVKGLEPALQQIDGREPGCVQGCCGSDAGWAGFPGS